MTNYIQKTYESSYNSNYSDALKAILNRCEPFESIYESVAKNAIGLYMNISRIGYLEEAIFIKANIHCEELKDAIDQAFNAMCSTENYIQDVKIALNNLDAFGIDIHEYNEAVICGVILRYLQESQILNDLEMLSEIIANRPEGKFENAEAAHQYLDRVRAIVNEMHLYEIDSEVSNIANELGAHEIVHYKSVLLRESFQESQSTTLDLAYCVLDALNELVVDIKRIDQYINIEMNYKSGLLTECFQESQSMTLNQEYDAIDTFEVLDHLPLVY